MDDINDIRNLVEGWAIWRDTGDWEKLRRAYHDDGWMVTTWFEGSAAEFVDRSMQAWERGSVSHHVLGGCFAEVSGHRAIAQTRMVLNTRGTVDDVEVDVACTGRFFDFMEKRGARWGITLRQPVYEKDRLDPVEPGLELTLDRSVLERFPVGYRHLAYVQSKSGRTVAPNLPGLRGPEIEHVKKLGRAWLDGSLALSGGLPPRSGAD